MTARRRSPRSTREAIVWREDGQRDLIAALLKHADPVRRDLAGRLDRCQQAREARRGWRGTACPVSDDYPYLCRLASCSECGRRIVYRWEDAARRRFEGADNMACSTAAVALARVARVEAVCCVVAKARKDFGNLRAAMCGRPGGWRWRTLLAFGVVEVCSASAPMRQNRGVEERRISGSS